MALELNAYKDIGNKVLVALAGINRDSTIDNDGYKYDDKYFHIHNRFLNISWSKSLIKQMLVYIASSNSVGEIHFISEKDIAESIGISVRTVQHNNKILQSQDILTWDRLFVDMIHVTFNHYKYDISGFEEISISDKKGNGKKTHSSGYTKLSCETIMELIKEDDVNVLRATLRLFAMTETQFYGAKQLPEISVFYKDLTNFLPSYVGYKAKIKDICAKVQKYVPVEIVEGAQSVKTFIQSRNVTKNMIKKAKDALVYLIDKDKFQPDSLQFNKEAKQFENNYQYFLAVAKFDKLLPVDKDKLKLYRDDIGTLISSFGIEKLDAVLNKLLNIMNTYKKLKEKLERNNAVDYNSELYNSKDFTYLNAFYYNPSMGIRFLASELNI